VRLRCSSTAPSTLVDAMTVLRRFSRRKGSLLDQNRDSFRGSAFRGGPRGIGARPGPRRGSGRAAVEQQRGAPRNRRRSASDSCFGIRRAQEKTRRTGDDRTVGGELPRFWLREARRVAPQRARHHRSPRSAAIDPDCGANRHSTRSCEQAADAGRMAAGSISKQSAPTADARPVRASPRRSPSRSATRRTTRR